MAEIDRDTLPTVAEGRALAGDATGGATGAPAEAVEIDPEMPLAGSREALTPLDEQGLRSSRPPRLPAAWPARRCEARNAGAAERLVLGGVQCHRRDVVHAAERRVGRHTGGCRA